MSVYFKNSMIGNGRLPPLPKGKTSSLRHILKITTNKTIPTTFLDLSLLPAHSPSLNHLLAQKQRPLSSTSATSQQSRANSRSGIRSGASASRSRLNPYVQMPRVTAKSWILYEMREGRCLYGKRNLKKREIASLTKIMNLITILEIVQLLKLDPKTTKVRVSQRACAVTGTSAELREGALYSLDDLYYGMMLPSGNDAAMAIAEAGGCLLKGRREEGRWGEEEELPDEVEREGGSAVGIFLRQMNRLARQIGMLNTNFANPHGLSNTSSHSTASDIAKLCAYAMRNPAFRKIVRTQQHPYKYTLNHKIPKLSKTAKFQLNFTHSISGHLQDHSKRVQYKSIDSNQKEQKIRFNEDDKENIDPNVMVPNRQQHGIWQNTNRMLGEGWSGIKTGITPNAGPCLAASFCTTISGRQLQFLVVLLKSQNMEARWQEVRAIINWAIDTKLYQ